MMEDAYKTLAVLLISTVGSTPNPSSLLLWESLQFSDNKNKGQGSKNTDLLNAVQEVLIDLTYPQYDFLFKANYEGRSIEIMLTNSNLNRSADDLSATVERFYEQMTDEFEFTVIFKLTLWRI